MRISDKIEAMIEAQGFKLVGDFRVIRGPKAKSDILECWSVEVEINNRKVQITSGDTMSRLVKCGFKLVINPQNDWHYGDYVVEAISTPLKTPIPASQPSPPPS